MAIRYESLDLSVRQKMLVEVQQDLRSGRLYMSPRLNRDGLRLWPELLMEACTRHHDAWLAGILQERGLIRVFEERQSASGVKIARVPMGAAEMLSEGEFNRYYVRGVCADMLMRGVQEVQVVRGRASHRVRPESRCMEGAWLSAEELLASMRMGQGEGILVGPNSGMTVRGCLAMSGRL